MDERAEPATVRPPAAGELSPGSRGARLLVAGVGGKLRQRLLSLLQDGGYDSVLEVATGCQVLASLAQLPAIGVVIIERELPDVDGLEVCRRIRECQRWVDVQTLVLTGDVRLETTEAIYSAGASDYLSRPLRQGELAARVARAVDLYLERRTRRDHGRQLEVLAARYAEFARQDGAPLGGQYPGLADPPVAPGIDHSVGRPGAGIGHHIEEWLPHVGPDDVTLITRVLNEACEAPVGDHHPADPRPVVAGDRLSPPRRRRHKTVEDKLRLAAMVLEGSVEGVMITDAQSRIVAVNRAFSAITGYRSDEAVGQTPRLLHSGRQDRTFYQRIWRVIAEEGHWAGEVWNRRKDGEVYPEWLAIGPVKDRRGNVSHYVGVFTDISARKESEARIESLAYYDQVTGLPNRALFGECLARALSYAARRDLGLALMTLDLDRFKLVNDSLGHAAGDELLRRTRERIESAVRQEDTVARIGGDEFGVLLEGLADTSAPAAVAQKIQRALSAPFKVKGRDIYATASIGVALYPDDATEAEALMKHADTAMYRAKELGRSTYQFYTPEMNALSSLRLVLETGLRKALERDEFVLHYQPLVDLATGEICGAEALLRWQHPEFGLIPPEQFIPLAEDTGLIVPIGEWVLSEACSQASEWAGLGLPAVRLAINLSARQFRQGNLTDIVPLVLKAASLDAQRLELEITEGVLMEHKRDTVQALQSFKDMGIRVAVDDFGTGYSSLSYLKRFPIDSLKIDQSFVREVDKDADSAAIVTAITAMAESLNLTVVAEGVETAEQLEFLRACACHRIQGFYFSQPLPAPAFAALLAVGLPSRTPL